MSLGLLEEKATVGVGPVELKVGEEVVQSVYGRRTKNVYDKDDDSRDKGPVVRVRKEVEQSTHGFTREESLRRANGIIF